MNSKKLEAEINLLGILFWDNQKFKKISALINADDFSDPTNKKIFIMIKKLVESNKLANATTVCKHFELNEEVVDPSMTQYVDALARFGQNT